MQCEFRCQGTRNQAAALDRRRLEPSRWGLRAHDGVGGPPPRRRSRRGTWPRRPPPARDCPAARSRPRRRRGRRRPAPAANGAAPPRRARRRRRDRPGDHQVRTAVSIVELESAAAGGEGVERGRVRIRAPWRACLVVVALGQPAETRCEGGGTPRSWRRRSRGRRARRPGGRRRAGSGRPAPARMRSARRPGRAPPPLRSSPARPGRPAGRRSPGPPRRRSRPAGVEAVGPQLLPALAVEQLNGTPHASIDRADGADHQVVGAERPRSGHRVDLTQAPPVPSAGCSKIARARNPG